MHYQKIKVGSVVIEFHNNWLGEESVIVNGNLVSKKYSFWGIDHPFSIIESGHNVRYILTTKVTPDMQVKLDLRRNGQLLHENLGVKTTFGKGKKVNLSKKKGLKLLMEYDLDDALSEFKFALDIDPDDPEIYFHMACVNSLMENTAEAYLCVAKAVDLHLKDQEMIFNHDMLAFLRLDLGFEDFVESGFTKFSVE